jgi:hypothetical protein
MGSSAHFGTRAADKTIYWLPEQDCNYVIKATLECSFQNRTYDQKS